MNSLETIRYNEADNSITIIDQTKLPNALVYKTLVSSQDVYHAIKDLEVRGAPLIGITAAYGLLMSALNAGGQSASDLGLFCTFVRFEKSVLESARPTAVNLANALNRMVDGLIVAPTCDSQAFVREILGEKPTVFVDREPQELKGVDCVVNDTQRGSREAVEMLIKEGHRHIGILSGILGKNTMADLRIQGYLEAMEKYDIPVDQDWILEGESSRMAGYRMMQMLAEKDDITAVFISSNIVAMGAVEYLNRHPKHQSRIQIIVYDDYEWVNTCVQPFTTIRQDAKCLGETAARMLLSRIADPQKKTEVRRLPTSLIRR